MIPGSSAGEYEIGERGIGRMAGQNRAAGHLTGAAG